MPETAYFFEHFEALQQALPQMGTLQRIVARVSCAKVIMMLVLYRAKELRTAMRLMVGA
jgi:hypothetical protein